MKLAREIYLRVSRVVNCPKCKLLTSFYEMLLIKRQNTSKLPRNGGSAPFSRKEDSFLKNWVLSLLCSYAALTLHKKSEKTNELFYEILKDESMDEQTDGRAKGYVNGPLSNQPRINNKKTSHAWIQQDLKNFNQKIQILQPTKFNLLSS